MDALWKSDDVAAALGVKSAGLWVASGVMIDSRAVSQGDVFVALKGERVDGHLYVADALKAGAVAAIVEYVPEGVAPEKCLLVADTLAALQALGVAARQRSNAKVVGVTGSIGKTGSKEMLRHLLASGGTVYATSGNYNNHIGVPLTLANLPANTRFAIVEMGMNHAGEISLLSGWVRPDISLITTVEEAHIEFFDSVEGIADAKAEIFDGMGAAGVAVLNRDNPHYARLYQHALNKGLDRIVSFGTGEHALSRLLEYRIENLQSVVDVVIAGTRVQYRMGAIGKHWALMSVAALAVADALGLDLARAAESLISFEEPKGRGRIEEIQVNGGCLRLLDDAYNASPASMIGAIEKLAMLRDSEVPPARTVAILGDMLELGDRSKDLHVGLAPTLVNNHIDLVFAAGDFMLSLYESLPDAMRGDYDRTALGLSGKVVDRLRARDLVLVKGSNGSKISEVAQAIRGLSTQRDIN